MRLSAAALLVTLGLVTAAPYHQSSNVQSVVTHIHGSDIAEHGASKALVQVDISITPQSGSGYSTPSVGTKEDRIPGWIFFDGNRVQGRIHGNTYWNIKGELSEKFPIDEFLMDPLIFSLNHPTDFEGEFSGSSGKGEVTLTWKSGATITGRSRAEFGEIKGKTRVDWSP